MFKKKRTRTSRKCFVSRREWNSIDPIITYRSYSISLREKDTDKPFLPLISLSITRIISYNNLFLKKKKYSRYNKTRGRLSFESREEYSPSSNPNKIRNDRRQTSRRSLKSSKWNSIPSNPPLFPSLPVSFVVASKLICRERKAKKKKRKKETRVQLNGIPRRRQRNGSPFSSFSFIEKMRRDERWKWNPRFQSREQRFWKTRSKSSSKAAWDRKTENVKFFPASVIYSFT